MMHESPARCPIPTRSARIVLGCVFTLSMAGAVAAPPVPPGISSGIVKIGVLTDLSSVSSDNTGKGSVVAARMAIDDFAHDHKVLGAPIELVVADSHGSAETGAAIAHDWYERQQVDMITDLTFSHVALAVDRIADEDRKLALVTGAGATAISGEQCTAHSVQWMYDTYSISNGTIQTLLKRNLNSWFFITSDYAFGHSLQKSASDIVLRNGGRVVGSVSHPVNSPDQSTYVAQARASGAQVIALANSGLDTLNTIEEAARLNPMQPRKQIVTPLLALLTEIHGIGLQSAQGLLVTEGFYWDRDERSRAFGQRFFAIHQRMPTMIQAGVYSAVLNYLKAVQTLGTDDADAVMAQLKSVDINDPVIRHGQIRADGKLVHDMYLAQVKTPAQSHSEWDLYRELVNIPADQAFAPLSASPCALVKR